MKPSTLIGFSVLGLVISILGPAYLRFPYDRYVMGALFWASLAVLLVGGYLGRVP
jgi:hypothetical protein